MRKKISSYIAYAFITISMLGVGEGLLTSCIEDSFREYYPHSTPSLSDLQLSKEGTLKADEELMLSVKVNGNSTPLSTLEIKMTAGGAAMYKESIRTKGYSSEITNHSLSIPFKAGFEETDANLTLTAVNVEGDEASISTGFHIQRPAIPSTIYLHMNDDRIVTMRKSAANEYLYESSKGSYPQEFTARISTAKNYEDSEFIWGYSTTPNTAEIIDKTGAGFSFNFANWRIDRITFNVFTFELGVIGESENAAIGDLTLTNEQGLFKGSGYFEKGRKYSVTGIDDIATCYNRDFFELNNDGTVTFIRESGNWDIAYSKKYNYIWVYRMSDNAPDCFWLVGHGFTCAPKWHTDYTNADGWTFEDITHMGYLVKIDDNKYQATTYLNPDHKWSTFEVEIYSDRAWGKGLGMLLYDGNILGDNTGFAISKSNGFTNGDNFTPGYYRLTFDTSEGIGKEKMYVERIGD